MNNVKQNHPKKRKHTIWINLMIIILLLLGTALVFNKQIESFWLQWIGQQKVTTVTRSEVVKAQKIKSQYDSDAVKALSLDAMLAAQKAKNQYAIGVISIPAVGIKLPIYKGMTNITLAIGAGTMKPNQRMGKANYALAGHHMANPQILFSPLSNIENGDKIYLTNLKKVYTYQVRQHRIVSETQGDIINNHPKKTEITLITCASGTPGETRRIAVTGDYQKQQKLTKSVYQHYFN